MVTGGFFPFYDSKAYDCRVIGLPYRQHLTTMYIILPNNSTRQRLRQLQATLSADKIDEMISKMEWRSSIVFFPKLHITNNVDLKAILNRMGLRSLFTYDQSDLSLISTGAEVLSSSKSFLGKGSNSHFLFSRLGGNDTENRNATSSVETNKTSTSEAPARNKRSAVTYKAISSDFHSVKEPLRLKDLVIDKRITKSYPHKKALSRGRRQIPADPSITLKRIDALRSILSSENAPNPRLFANELIHQIDLTVNEMGTEGGAATVTTLRRSGPDVLFRTETPFLFLIRHEDTKLPIFYGAVFEPTNN